MMPIRVYIPAIIVGVLVQIQVLFCPVHSVHAARTVPTTSERGGIFTYPYNNDWSGMGAIVFGALSDNFAKMPPDGLKVKHARFHHFNSWDDTGNHTGFPYSKLIAFNNAEIAAGRPPVMVTATYQGKTRYLYSSWGHPSGNRFQLADVADDRFIKFFVEEYARKIAYPGQSVLGPADWIGSDNGMFNPTHYGVIDDGGGFVRFGSSGLTMNDPFWKTPAEYYADIATFFRKIKEQYPDVKIMVNIGTMGDWSYFEQVFQDIPGIMHEDLFKGVDGSVYDRDTMYDWWTRYKWFASRNKAVLLRVRDIPNDPDVIRTAYLAYLMVWGENYFHNLQPAGADTSEMNPALTQPIRDAVGDPIGEFQSTQESGKSRGYRVYSRQTTKGMIYINFSGSSKTITLPTDKTYYSRSGGQVSSITIPEGKGDYVTFTGTPRPTATPGPTTPTATTVPTTGTPTGIPTGIGKTGDANGDGKVDGVDYTIWLNNYLATSTQGPAVGDFNRDGKVDGVDYTLWLTNYLT